MAAVLRRFVSLPPSAKEEDDDYSVEYSFALEYKGPPLFSDIPQAVPIHVDQIPTASVVPSNSLLLDLSLPIISPIKRTGFGCKKSEEEVTKYASSESLDEDDPASFACSDRKDHATPVTLCLPESLEDCREGISEIVELESARYSPSSDYFSQKEEDSDCGTPRHVRKSSIVTFRHPDSGDIVDEEESVLSETDLIPVKQKAEKNGKKGSCYRCLRGNKFTEKEVCIVCDAKYCRSCVLRAMGSMPEGRKCVTCIGYRIDESKRDSLGVCSRMLKRMLTELEIQRVMDSEVSCTSNQLPPNLVYVNDQPLTQAELALLQSCLNPPKRLKPGYYWYDKVCGYWGKEGHRPCQIITAQLNIGGHMKRSASNGNTNILINKREITREEVWMLKASGISCEGKPHFWVSEDGSYLEEGQKNVVGRLWDKRKTKLLCAVLSLPIPPNITSSGGEDDAQNKLEQNALRKLLLVGPDKSGTSTIFKQTKLLYGVPFTEDERKNIKLMIQSNLYGYLGILLEGRERFAEESLIDEKSRAKGKSLLVEQSISSGIRNRKEDNSTYSMGPRLKAFSDWLLKVIESGNLEVMVLSATREYAPFVEEFWKDGAIQATYNRRSELGKLPRVATYFLERAIEISREDYEPSDMDILYAEGITSSNGLACTEFSFPKSEADESINLFDQNDDLLRYQLIRVHPRILGENCKWLEMFADVNMVVFCVSLADYDEFVVDGNGVSVNKMLASKQLLETIATHPTFYKKDFLLVLNKFDLLEEKIEQVPLAQCEWFRDFSPVIGHNHNTGNYVNGNPSVAERAFHYIGVKFKRFFFSLTGRKLYVSSVTGLEQDSVDGTLRYAREVMNWEFREMVITIEESSTSIEASTS